MDSSYVLAIDQGTSSTKTLIIDEEGRPVCKASEPLHTSYFDNGFVEQDPEGILQNVLLSVDRCLAQFKGQGLDTSRIKACGISNQRETFVLWDEDGKPLCNAVVWQCKRSVAVCERLKEEGLEGLVKAKTGLLLDPYFSGTKLIWLYENEPGVKKAVDEGRARFGTVDTWLLFKLTGGKAFATDYTNASRTLFFNLVTLSWDAALLDEFGLSRIKLPVCRPSSAYYGETNFDGLLPQPLPVTAMIGDSHAAAFGEGCFAPGTAKATTGTGCSVLMNTGDEPVLLAGSMVSTICWSTEEKIAYALEGVIVSCGATLEWLRKDLGLYTNTDEIEAIARSVSDNGGVYLIPAFSGLGAPHWDTARKASISGLTFHTDKRHVVRAAVESIPYQICDVLEVMEAEAGLPLGELMIDGGASSNGFMVQLLSDLLQKPVVSIGMPDVSALGAGYLAGLKTGLYKSLEQLQGFHHEKKCYRPAVNDKIAASYAGWKKAIAVNTTPSYAKRY